MYFHTDKYEILGENDQNCIYKVMILAKWNKDNHHVNNI